MLDQSVLNETCRNAQVPFPYSEELLSYYAIWRDTVTTNLIMTGGVMRCGSFTSDSRAVLYYDAQYLTGVTADTELLYMEIHQFLAGRFVPQVY